AGTRSGPLPATKPPLSAAPVILEKEYGSYDRNRKTTDQIDTRYSCRRLRYEATQAGPSWVSASLTTETLPALPARARMSSNGWSRVQPAIAASWSPARSLSSSWGGRRGATLTRREVKPRAPLSQKNGPQVPAGPQPHPSRPAPTASTS